MNEFKDRMVSAEGWEGKMRPVNVNGMFFADNPDKMDGWGCGMGRRKNNWALWVDGHGFVCGGENMCYPVRPWPFTMEKEVAKKLCKVGIANWGQIFFVENKDYYKKLIEKAVKKMGYIQLDNPLRFIPLYGRTDTTPSTTSTTWKVLRCAFSIIIKTRLNR